MTQGVGYYLDVEQSILLWRSSVSPSCYKSPAMGTPQLDYPIGCTRCTLGYIGTSVASRSHQPAAPRPIGTEPSPHPSTPTGSPPAGHPGPPSSELHRPTCGAWTSVRRKAPYVSPPLYDHRPRAETPSILRNRLPSCKAFGPALVSVPKD